MRRGAVTRSTRVDMDRNDFELDLHEDRMSLISGGSFMPPHADGGDAIEPDLASPVDVE